MDPPLTRHGTGQPSKIHVRRKRMSTNNHTHRSMTILNPELDWDNGIQKSRRKWIRYRNLS
jgi:hypothetical protein